MTESIVNEISGYITSKDYRWLSEICKDKSIVCIVDYRHNKDDSTPIRDVAQTCYSPNQGCLTYQVQARGICYIHARNVEEFVHCCEKKNLKFIIPRADL